MQFESLSCCRSFINSPLTKYFSYLRIIVPMRIRCCLCVLVSFMSLFTSIIHFALSTCPAPSFEPWKMFFSFSFCTPFSVSTVILIKKKCYRISTQYGTTFCLKFLLSKNSLLTHRESEVMYSGRAFTDFNRIHELHL